MLKQDSLGWTILILVDKGLNNCLESVGQSLVIIFMEVFKREIGLKSEGLIAPSVFGMREV